MRRIVSSLYILAFLAAPTALAGAAVDDTVYSQPGQRISIGSGLLNLYCIGSGSPTVVFDAGWGDWSPSWAIVQPRVAKWTRACSFDHAGYGFSDAGPMPRTSVRIADELHTALHNAALSGPYLLVAHAFGSYNLRAFADRYMRDVGGIVLVDADDSDVEPAKWRARDNRNIRKIVATMRLCQSAVVRGLPLPPLPSPGGPPPVAFRPSTGHAGERSSRALGVRARFRASAGLMASPLNERTPGFRLRREPSIHPTRPSAHSP